MPFTNFRIPYGFDPRDYDYQNAGGVPGLLRQVMLKQAVDQEANRAPQPDATSNGYLDAYGNPGGLFGRLLAFQANQGRLTGGGGPHSFSPDTDASKSPKPLSNAQRNLADSYEQNIPPTSQRSSNGSADERNSVPVNTSAYEHTVPAGAQSSREEQIESPRLAQAIPPVLFEFPYTFFARPPIVPRQYTPLEQLSKGSRGGDGAYKIFERNVGRPKEGEPTPPCRYCGRPTTREPGPDQYQRDHIDPRSKGGNNSEENLGDSCRTCNLRKHNKTQEEFYEWLKREGLMIEDHA